MIYTLTFNPALDYIVTVPDFQPGRTNRTGEERMLPGGKGINVSLVLRNLGLESTALGFTAGFTGEEIERKLKERRCRTDFIRLPDGFSRINLKLRNMDGTEINGRGPAISPECLQELFTKLEQLTKEDTLILAGSIPASLPDNIYRQILRKLALPRPRIIADAEGELLLQILEFGPFLIKPNLRELCGLFGKELQSRGEILSCARRLREMGASNVLVSLGGEGALLAAEDGACYACPAPAGTVVSSVGAGDSMVAGFLAGWLEQHSLWHAFCTAVAAGSASAFSRDLASREEVDRLYPACRAAMEQLTE